LFTYCHFRWGEPPRLGLLPRLGILYAPVLMEETVAKYRRLDSQKIVETVQTLQRRIEGRFPGSGLGRIAAELLSVAQETIARIHWIQKPHLLLRCAAAILSAAIIALLAGLLIHIRQFQFDDYANSIQALEASISSVVFIGAAILFFVSWENRIKRRRALKAIHELRAMAHIVDMHQLTKDPESCYGPGLAAASTQKRPMTPYDETRYMESLKKRGSIFATLHVEEKS